MSLSIRHQFSRVVIDVVGEKETALYKICPIRHPTIKSVAVDNKKIIGDVAYLCSLIQNCMGAEIKKVTCKPSFWMHPDKLAEAASDICAAIGVEAVEFPYKHHYVIKVSKEVDAKEVLTAYDKASTWRIAATKRNEPVGPRT